MSSNNSQFAGIIPQNYDRYLGPMFFEPYAIDIASRINKPVSKVLELACGTPPAPRERTLGDLKKLQQAVTATNDEVLALIESNHLYDTGCGAIDMALLASVLLTRDARLWTMDKNLAALTDKLGIAFNAADLK